MSDFVPVDVHPPSWPSRERRGSPRYSLGGVAEVLGTDAEAFRADVGNISLSGCYLATRHQLPLHARVMLRLDISGSAMEFIATVCRTDAGGVGLRFESAPASQPSE